MEKKCNNCATGQSGVLVPYVVHEAVVSQQERQIKRMWVALIVCLVIMFLMNMAWIGAWTSYDYSSEEIIVDAEDNGNANYIGQDGNIYNGQDNSPQTETN